MSYIREARFVIHSIHLLTTDHVGDFAGVAIQTVDLSHAACKQILATQADPTPRGEPVGAGFSRRPNDLLTDMRKILTNCPPPGMG